MFYFILFHSICLVWFILFNPLYVLISFILFLYFVLSTHLFYLFIHLFISIHVFYLFCFLIHPFIYFRLTFDPFLLLYPLLLQPLPLLLHVPLPVPIRQERGVDVRVLTSLQPRPCRAIERSFGRATREPRPVNESRSSATLQCRNWKQKEGIFHWFRCEFKPITTKNRLLIISRTLHFSSFVTKRLFVPVHRTIPKQIGLHRKSE